MLSLISLRFDKSISLPPGIPRKQAHESAKPRWTYEATEDLYTYVAEQVNTFIFTTQCQRLNLDRLKLQTAKNF